MCVFVYREMRYFITTMYQNAFGDRAPPRPTERASKMNKYERYYGPGRHPLAYVLYYKPTISPAST